jgi:hypothetical protein
MVFTTAGGGATQETGYEIDNSLRFNYPDNPQLSFTPSSDGNKRVATASFWLKRGVSRASNDLHIMGSQEDGSNLYSIRIRSSGNADVFQFLNAVSGSTSNGFTYKSTAAIRDHSAWYHFVVAMDVTQSDSNNGLKLYVNGVLQTSNTIGSYNQNVDVSFNTSGEAMKIGIKSDDSDPFDGYLADFHWIDGTQKQASDFGEYNDNGVWIPKEYDGSYGTNGFYLEFKQTGTSQNSSGIGADTSGNDNHFAVSNLAATDVTVDTPTNNFATLNPLNSSASVALSEGNTKHTNSGANDQASAATMGFTKGKWYWEVKCVDKAEVGINLNSDILILSNDSTVGSNDANIKATSLITNSAGGSNDLRHNGSNESITSVSVADGDIISVAVDADNGKIWFAKNGTYFNSGDPAAGSNEAKDFSGAYTSGNFITPVGLIATGDGDIFEINFGNPSFSISSGNFDGAGYGNFEYAVPSGYYSLCTKNLAEYG